MVLRDLDNLFELVVVVESKVAFYHQHTLVDLVIGILGLILVGE